MQLFLRLFADCENAEAAVGIAERLALALTPFSTEPSSSLQPYWKLPHLFEFTYDLSPATEASFQEIASRSSGGWQHSSSDGEHSCVWNRSPGHVLLLPEVCWAELQLFE